MKHEPSTLVRIAGLPSRKETFDNPETSSPF